MSTLGFFVSCFNENRAVKYSLSELIKHYPESPIYLVSDGGEDFSYLELTHRYLSASLGEDTMSETFKITAGISGCDRLLGNYAEDYYQGVIKKCVMAILSRLESAIGYCKTDYILMMDADTLVRGRLTIPDGVKLLGSRVNKNFPKGLQDILSQVEGAKVIDCWGATPGIFEAKTFLKALNVFRADSSLLDRMCMEFYAMYAHDMLLPILFALVGEEETFNPEIVECIRSPYWESTPQPLVHQYRLHYEK